MGIQERFMEALKDAFRDELNGFEPKIVEELVDAVSRKEKAADAFSRILNVNHADEGTVSGSPDNGGES